MAGPCAVPCGQPWGDTPRLAAARRPVLLHHRLHFPVVAFHLRDGDRRVFQVAGAVKAEVILSFLGLGVKKGPSWGIMISHSSQEVINGFFWQINFV